MCLSDAMKQNQQLKRQYEESSFQLTQLQEEVATNQYYQEILSIAENNHFL